MSAAVTIAVAALVALAMRWPLAAGGRAVAVDAREPPHFSLFEDATFVGFWEPQPFGRWTPGPQASVILNRPLPEHSLLTIEARAVGDYIGVPIRVRAGATESSVRFGIATPPTGPSVRLTVHNPGALRDIEFELPALERSAEAADPLRGLVLRRILIEEAATP